LRHAGLALATALSAILNMGLLVVFLARRLGAFGWEAILRSHARVLLASVPIVLTCLWFAGLAVWAQPGAWAAKTVMLIVGIGISVGGYEIGRASCRERGEVSAVVGGGETGREADGA